MPIPESTCEKDSKPGIGECCCSCRHRADDHDHPWLNDEQKSGFKGYICVLPLKSKDGRLGACSGWWEHGLCEMWEGLNNE